MLQVYNTSKGFTETHQVRRIGFDCCVPCFAIFGATGLTCNLEHSRLCFRCPNSIPGPTQPNSILYPKTTTPCFVCADALYFLNHTTQDVLIPRHGHDFIYIMYAFIQPNFKKNSTLVFPPYVWECRGDKARRQVTLMYSMGRVIFRYDIKNTNTNSLGRPRR